MQNKLGFHSLTKKIKLMGVVNVTPDSFSDGGRFSSVENFSGQVTKLLRGGCSIIDIGAQSTAPFNQTISAQEELARLKEIIDPLKKLLAQSDFIVSLDTFYPQVAFDFFSQVDCAHGVWNDVSGQYDDHVHKFLNRFKHCHYIFCHNGAPNRELAGDHMSYVAQGNICSVVTQAFLGKDHERVCLDPCFGFSKDYKQNWELIHGFEDLRRSFSQTMVFGVSKKSFMRQKVQELVGHDSLSKESLFYYSEVLHSKLIDQLVSSENNDDELWIRLHDPNVALLGL